MLASGIDLIEVERIDRALARHGQRFLDRIFTMAEQEICAENTQRLAGRFAVKEAVSKALGCGIGDISWLDIEVRQGLRGEPILHLHANAQRIANAQDVSSWSISISHTATHAIGMAVALKRQPS